MNHHKTITDVEVLEKYFCRILDLCIKTGEAVLICSDRGKPLAALEPLKDMDG